MFSMSGTTLIATVIPIGLVIIAIDLRRGLQKMVAGNRAGFVLMRAVSILLVGAVVGGVIAEWICIDDVSQNVVPRGVDAVLIYVGGLLVFAASGLLLLLFLFDTLGIIDSLGRRKAMQLANGPAAPRLAKMEEINRYAPGTFSAHDIATTREQAEREAADAESK